MHVFLLFTVTLLRVCQGVNDYEMDFPCVDSTWTYVPRSGKCYRLFSDTTRYKQKEAHDNCRTLLKNYPTVSVTIAEVRDSNDLEALKHVLVQKSLKERVLLNARRDNTNQPFVWQSDNVAVNLDFVSWSGGVGNGNCLAAFYTTERVGSQWQTVAVVEEDGCDDGHAVICEHKVKDCENPPGGFNPNTMQFSPTKPHPGTTTTVVCMPGFYPRPAKNSSKAVHSKADDKPSPAQFTCVGERANPGVADPSQYQVHFSYNGLPLNECDAIRCNETEMHAMLPEYATLSSARSRLTEEEFGPLQVNQFSQFGNVVTYRCYDSYFYPDRSFEKYVECGLKAGESSVGEWKGYSGTLLPLPSSCQPVTCMYEDVLVKGDYNIQANFTITFENGTKETRSKLKPVFYPYMTTIRYVCQEGYETVTKTPDQNITCGPVGRWRPQIYGCITVAANLTTSSAGRYVPPPIEAPSANQLGAVVIGIIVIFFVSLVLLDLATLHRDIGWFFNNVRLQKRLWLAKRRLRKAKSEAKAKQ
ncbi:C type lectin domian containing protein [Echinococcus multilocularis]|uniref:C type lectin domian containing protein n=1 Tax=Echinococcus multilocularis TaxID=6211 RepID=A0A087W0R5_ECHMU|nr:C type lectin domian containing protein [Echinococcus multilocularis]